MEFKLKEFENAISVTKMANIHYFEFIKEYHTFKDKHPFRELVYVDSGAIRVDAEGYSGTLCSKQLIIHKSNEIHSLSCFENDAPNVIIIGFECESERLDEFSQNAYTLSNELIRILTEVIKEGRSVFLPPYDIPNLRDMKKRGDFPFGADQMLRLKFEMFLIELIRSVEPVQSEQRVVHTDSKIEEIFTYVNNNYKEKITLDDLCFLFGTNKTTICKSFKEAYGDTVINYINKMRIKNAKKLMRQGELNLTQLSSRVGFSSIHYFSKLFKSYENMSPSEYLNTIKSRLEE
ncbi:MAG: helix-turn-helix transcriptional regulator [Clostridia bacterium]|nr:helix-turn-helix transcriptional regulator [Clostridia bacterium]